MKNLKRFIIGVLIGALALLAGYFLTSCESMDYMSRQYDRMYAGQDSVIVYQYQQGGLYEQTSDTTWQKVK